MVTFELLCMGIIAFLVGAALCFNGYRWFLALLPLLGFVYGFGMGAQTIQALFGGGLFSTATSLVVGLIVGLVFGFLSYLFYIIGVALVAGAFGYSLGVGFMNLIGIDLNLLTWIVGVITGLVVGLGTVLLNLQKWVIIALTSFTGAGVIIGTLLVLLGVITPGNLSANAVRAALSDSFLWLVFFVVLGVLGVISQVISSQRTNWEPQPTR